MKIEVVFDVGAGVELVTEPVIVPLGSELSLRTEDVSDDETLEEASVDTPGVVVKAAVAFDVNPGVEFVAESVTEPLDPTLSLKAEDVNDNERPDEVVGDTIGVVRLDVLNLETVTDGVTTSVTVD